MQYYHLKNTTLVTRNSVQSFMTAAVQSSLLACFGQREMIQEHM